MGRRENCSARVERPLTLADYSISYHNDANWRYPDRHPGGDTGIRRGQAETRSVRSVRLRHENIAGQARANLPPGEDLVNLRTIIRARYRTDPITFVVDVWDSRVFDAGRPSAISNNEVNGLEPMRAHAAIDFGSNRGISGRATIGRMIFELGSARLIANDDYRNTTSGFTGLKVDLKGPSRLSGTLL